MVEVRPGARSSSINDPGVKLFPMEVQRKKKRSKKRKKLRKRRLVESAAAEEINKVACGDIFLMISTSCLEALLGSHTYHKPDDYLI